MKCQTCGSTNRTLAQSKFIPSHYNVCGVCRMEEGDEFYAEKKLDIWMSKQRVIG